MTKQQEKTKRIANAIGLSVFGAMFGVIVGIFLIYIGVALFFFVPILGWIIGPLLIITGISLPFTLATTGFTKQVKGACPRCANKLQVISHTKALTCGVCRRRILVVNNGFQLA